MKFIPNEPIIVMNGTQLTCAQAMTIRVAIESFAASMRETNALGNDAHGKKMAKAYRKRNREISRLMYPERKIRIDGGK